jgi:hypothetical protein
MKPYQTDIKKKALLLLKNSTKICKEQTIEKISSLFKTVFSFGQYLPIILLTVF